MSDVSLAVDIGSLALRNPILTASGTYGLGYEFARLADLGAIGGVVGKTVTAKERIGNPPPRTFETPAGMLNSIGLMNPGFAGFVEQTLPRVSALPCPFVMNVAGEDADEFAWLSRKSAELTGIAALELNLSCPNVSNGLDFSRDPALAARVVSECVAAVDVPVWAKLSPNVEDVVPIAAACEEAGASAVSLVNTYLGTAIDWRGRRTIFAREIAGLSGPAIKPMALLTVLRVSRAIRIPVVGIGGIRDAEDVLQYLAAGASAVQVGTACFLDPELPVRLVADVASKLAAEGIEEIRSVIGAVHGDAWRNERRLG